MPAYAGIGSRQTPTDVLHLMLNIAVRLGINGKTLRSGGAVGADSAFEVGCDSVDGDKEIYLPWRTFNAHPSRLCNPHPNAFVLAAQFHPNWNACSDAAQKLHARNCHQILGRNLDDPVEGVVCWTQNAAGGGGTGQALRIAKHLNIRIYDLADPSTRDHIEQELKT